MPARIPAASLAAIIDLEDKRNQLIEQQHDLSEQIHDISAQIEEFYTTPATTKYGGGRKPTVQRRKPKSTKVSTKNRKG